MTQNPQGSERNKTTLKLPTLTILAASKMTKITPAVAADGTADGANPAQLVDAKVRNASQQCWYPGWRFNCTNIRLKIPLKSCLKEKFIKV